MLFSAWFDFVKDVFLDDTRIIFIHFWFFKRCGVIRDRMAA
jgi:hypothetical protein